jgi:hypothetical protein
MQHKWILEPRMTYRPFFDKFCSSIDLGFSQGRDSVLLLGDYIKKKTDSPPHEDDNGCRSAAQNSLLDTFCSSFDLRLVYKLLTGISLPIKMLGIDPRMINFAANSMNNKELSALVAASVLQGDYYDANLKRVYWGTQMGGGRLIPIVIDTGALISISGERSDFFEGVKEVGPDERIQGLNHSIQVMGIGKSPLEKLRPVGSNCSHQNYGILYS